MIEVTLICHNCGSKFRVKVFEPDEAEKKGAPKSPIRCPECGGTDVRR